VIAVHKRGRNYFYSLRRDVLRGVIDEVLGLSPGPRAADGSATGGSVTAGAADPEPVKAAGPASAPNEADALVTLLTW
jgi:hypothetical protein